MSQQFIKISNENIKNRKMIAKLSDIGTYMILQAFLSIPDFRTPAGGFFPACLKHCTNGRYSLRNSWNRLKEGGYLKRTRMPINKNYFYDHYKLLSSPNFTIEAVRNFNTYEGKMFFSNAPVSAEIASNDFTPVSRELIMDSHISLQAKGLYSIIQYVLSLETNAGGFVTTKDYIRKFCKEGHFAFNRYWKELKDNGYLLVIKQYYDKVLKKTVYKYGLKNCAINQLYTEGKDKLSNKNRNKNTVKYYSVYDPAELRKMIENNVNVDLLCDWAENRKDAMYSQEDVSDTVDLMIDTILNNNDLRYNKSKISASKLAERLMNVNYSKMHNVLNSYVQKPPKYNPINYLLSLLYSNSYTKASDV